MSFAVMSTTSCKPFALARPRIGARRALVCRAQAQETRAFRLAVPAAKALTAAAAGAMLAVKP